MKASCVIPARNEEDTIEGVVAAVRACEHVSEVIVVDNGSDDATAARAREAGAEVVVEPKVGLGHAIAAGASRAKSDWVVKTDGDIRNAATSWYAELLVQHWSRRAELTRAVFDTEGEDFPLTNLVVLPLLEVVRPDWLPIRRPLSGTYVTRRDLLTSRSAPGGWAFDFFVYAHHRSRGMPIVELDIGTLNDKIRPIGLYRPVAKELMEFILSSVRT